MPAHKVAAVWMGFVAILIFWGCEQPATVPTADAESADGEGQIAENVVEPSPFAHRPPDFSEQVAAARPAVVNIYTRTDPPGEAVSSFSPPGIVPRDRVRQSLGSGFIFDSQGLVLTNDHVVSEASEIAVRLLDDRVYSAQVVGRDPPTDIAVLQLVDSDAELPTVELGDSDELVVGNWVLAIGNPLGLASTVTAGIASATGRQVMPPGGHLRFQDFIQTDASINPGSSGGPLVNMQGEVVGIATATSQDGHGLGFAIPINMVRDILDDLLEYGRVRRSWLGIYVSDVPADLRDEIDLPEQGGALLTRLVDDGPAEQAGMEPGDVFLAIDGEEVDDAFHLSWLAATIGVDVTVDVRIMRGNDEVILPLTLGLLPED